MHLLYVHQHFSTPQGSAGTRSYELARRMVERGHNVTMICGSYRAGSTGLEAPFARGVRRGTVAGIAVVEFDLSYHNGDGFLRRVALFMRFAIRSTQIALTYSYHVLVATTTPLTAALPGIAARWLRRKCFVFEVRDLWPELPKAMGVIRNPLVLGALAALEWLAYRSANRLIGLAPGIVDGIARHGVAHDCIALIPNGCDLGIFDRAPNAWRPPTIATSTLLAVFAGTHGIANGLDAVLDAAAELRQRRRSDIAIVLVGDGMCKAVLQRRANNEGLDNVVFLAPVDKHKLAGLLAAADIGLQVLANVPAFYDGTSPNKFFDYIAAGLPVLNNYPGWLARMIDENGCGFAVPPNDASAFADALVAAADDRDALLAMANNARQLAASTFDRDKLAVRWAEWIEDAERC